MMILVMGIDDDTDILKEICCVDQSIQTIPWAQLHVRLDLNVEFTLMARTASNNTNISDTNGPVASDSIASTLQFSMTYHARCCRITSRSISLSSRIHPHESRCMLDLHADKMNQWQ